MIGANGSGKSTLLRLLHGDDQPDGGTIARRRGMVTAVLPQQVAPDERTPHQIVLAARPDLERIEQELDEVGRRLADPALAGDLDRMDRVLRRQAVLLEEFEQAGGHAFEGRGRSLLLQLGLDETAIDRPSDVRSGGQRKLIALAACLAAEPDLLLLDEPETHLDAEARSRLEASDPRVRRRGRHGLARSLPAGRDGDARSPSWTAAGSGSGRATTPRTPPSGSSSWSASSSST